MANLKPLNGVNHLIGALRLLFLCIKIGVLLVLWCTVLAAGVYTEIIFAAIDGVLLDLATNLDLTGYSQAIAHHTHAKITMNKLPVMLIYGILYCSLSLLTLLVYVEKRRQMLLVVLFYAAVFTLCLGLLSLGKIFNDFVPAYNLARRLIEMIISPLPIILLISTLTCIKGDRIKKAYSTKRSLVI